MPRAPKALPVRLARKAPAVSLAVRACQASRGLPANRMLRALKAQPVRRDPLASRAGLAPWDLRGFVRCPRRSRCTP